MIKLNQNIISILVLVLLSNYSFGKNISKSNRIIDGDTIVFNSKKIRFHGQVKKLILRSILNQIILLLLISRLDV